MMGLKNLLTINEGMPGFVGTEVELTPVFCRLRKKRLHKVFKHSYGNTASPLKLYRNEAEAANRAEVVLLPEELRIFTGALIDHPLLLPISFSQQLEVERGRYCITLTSQEPFADFAKRLSAALRKLG